MALTIPRQREPTMGKISMLVCDFDDSLFPTTQGLALGWNIDTITPQQRQRIQSRLQNLASSIHHLLLHGRNAGVCYILTAASREWVLCTVSSFMPQLLPLFVIGVGKNRPHIEILSAFDQYGTAFPDDPYEWKRRVLLQIVSFWLAKLIVTLPASPNVKKTLILVSIGDAEYEREATREVARICGIKARAAGIALYAKTIKLIDSPSTHHLDAQIEHLVPRLHELLTEELHLDAAYTTDGTAAPEKYLTAPTHAHE